MKIGFNYHPSKQGCLYWDNWDAAEILKDFQQMEREGFDAVRFFVFWRYFEPALGEYNEVMFDRLWEIASMAKSANLQVIPTILTIWMNGQLFDLPWREGRNLWRDALLIEREARFVHKVAQRLQSFDHILAYDIGDEMVYINKDHVTSLTQEEVVDWVDTITSAIRHGDPKALVWMGNDHNCLIGKHQFNCKNLSKSLDFVAIHGFPLWNPFHIESNDCVKATLYVPFLVQLAQLYGTPFIDEFGLYGASEKKRADYIEASGTSSLLHGAKGIIGWCWQDFESIDKPYAERPGERFVGFHHLDGQAKLSTQALLEVKKHANRIRDMTRPAPIIAIYVSELYHVGNVNNANEHTKGAALFYCYALLQRLHMPNEFANEQLERYKVVIVPSNYHMTAYDLQQLCNYVEQGGVVLYTPGSYLYGFGGEQLFGITLDDFTLDDQCQSQFSWGDTSFAVNWHAAGLAQIPIIRELTAVVLARFQGSDYPAVTMNPYGKGQAYYMNAPIERALNTPYLLEHEQVSKLYQIILDAAGVRSPAPFTHPEVETAYFYGEETELFYLINHSPSSVQGRLHQTDGDSCEISLKGKEVLCIEKRRSCL